MTKNLQPIPSGIPCKHCTEDIPQQRINACPGTTTCVKCSDVKTKKPITLQKGTGDDTYTETIIVDDEVYQKHLQIEMANRRALGIVDHKLEDEKPKTDEKI